MKLKELLYGIGLRPGPREYGFEIETFSLPREGEISFARWLHPKERRKEFTQGMVDALRSFLSDGDVAVDVGAHTGDSTLPVALAAGPGGRVFALEPNPYAFRVLAANAGLNRERTSIIALPFAATPEDGEYDFSYSDAGYCNGGRLDRISPWRHGHFFSLRVKGRNLSRFLNDEYPAEAERIRFVKIDTEGADREVFRSLADLLGRLRPYIKSEIHALMPGDERKGYYRDLRETGYRIHRCVTEEEYLGPVLAEGDMTKERHFDIFAVAE